ncbi:MAG: hypothetical protein KC503_14375, partial [Myxococcales bacterium]|nr:hypothetical protein [Myxococcales bacterium]
VLDNDVRAEALARAAVRLGKLALAKRRHALGALLEQHAAAYQRFDIGTMAALPCTPRAAWRAAGYVMLGGASAKEALASARCLPTVERLQLAISQPFLR